ncbi:hypothetical protein IV203_035436 [Nitzschia inconspicua]|uniref:PiggyBac transposable element-derived protein domain-containing protein n=1 Tax=Nitzschia inconspicua TaxID=303405 RepID=A0A9K3LDY5_9STRA|nr:hypothetical protein IV203_035436 [Nitzschia inconspicua]
MPPDPFTGIPADIQAFRDGWTEITDHGHPYEVVLARDFSDDYLAQRLCGTFQNMGAKVTSSLLSLGKEVSRASILELLLGDVAIVRLEQFTTEMLVKRNFPPLVPYEYREFLYTRWYRSRFNLSNDKSFSHFMPPLSRSLDIIIMDPHRFATIQSCTGGFSQAGRTGSEDSDVWMEAGAMLRKLNELEVAIFSRSASNLLNHGNGSIVVDDELIASRASDVEQKVVSNRKAGKEGPLLHTLPLSTGSGNDLEVAFDRGYGKLSSVEAIASRNLHVVTVAGTLGSRHPFNTPDEWISTLNKWKTKRGVDQQKILSWTLLCENWNLRGDPMLGEEVRIAERTKVGEKPIYAIALREVFDRKNPVKYLKFFASKNHRPYTFVAVERKELNDQNMLFSPRTPSPERSSVEQALLQSAQPLTIGQRCADRFLMKSMLLSGTMAGKIGTYVAEPSGAALSSIMEECIVSWFGRHKSTAMMASGTRNENPTLDRLRSSVKCMKGIFEVGLLCWNRNHAIGVTPDAIEDFVADVALECLRCLAAQKAIPLFPADVPQEGREERQFKSEFSEYKRKHGWPIRKFALKKFASDPFLKKLRLCTFVDHRPQRIRDVQPVIRENGTSQKVVRRKCVLCFVPGKMIPGTSTIKSKEIANNSTYMCPTCMVVLCKKTVGNSGAKSCHTLWHERHNLEAEGSKCRKRLRVAREMNDDEAQKRKLHATNASIKRHSPAKTSQQIQRSQTQVAINDPQDPQDSFDTVENVVEHVLENLMEMEHGEEHGDKEKEEDEHDFLGMEEYSDGSDE